LHFDPPKEELYDLEADPGEQAPLPATSQKTVRRRLLEIAREHLRRTLGQRDEKARAGARLREIRLEWTNSAVESPGKAASDRDSTDRASPVAS
jgi:hypothetical protein